MTSSQDHMARRAAELLRDRLARDIPDAIHQVRGDPGFDTGPSPSVEQVRRHVDAMNMVEEGLEGWQAGRRDRLEELEQFLASLEYFFDPIEVRVAGRAAGGAIDTGDRVHVRAWTGGSLHELAQVLEAGGLGPAEAGSRRVKRSMAAGVPRLDTLAYALEWIELVISLCPSQEVVRLDRNLVTGAPIELASPDEIRAILKQSPPGDPG